MGGRFSENWEPHYPVPEDRRKGGRMRMNYLAVSLSMISGLPIDLP